MRGQGDGPPAKLRAARDRRGWGRSDVVARLLTVAENLGEPPPGVDANQVVKWECGHRNPGAFYRPRLCLAFEADPPELGFEPTPGLLREIEQLKIRLVKRRQFLATGAAFVAASSASGLDLARLADVAAGRARDPRGESDLMRLALVYKDQAGQLSPATLMHPVVGLLDQVQVQLQAHPSPGLLDIAARLSVTAGGLSFDLGNHGDAQALWSQADDFAHQLGSNPLRAYTLGVLSDLYSRSNRRHGDARPPAAGTLTLQLLDRAVRMAERGATPSLRAWLYTRRAEEYATAGDRRAAYADIDRAHRALSRLSTMSDDFPIQGGDGQLSSGDDPRLTRHHGIVALMLQDHHEAVRILRGTLEALDPLQLTRSLALIDLAAAYVHLPSPELNEACNLLGEAREIARSAGIGEATRRILELRDQMYPWAADPVVGRLDERLGLL